MLSCVPDSPDVTGVAREGVPDISVERLIEGFPEAVVILDRAGDVCWANGRAAELFGVELADLLARNGAGWLTLLAQVLPVPPDPAEPSAAGAGPDRGEQRISRVGYPRRVYRWSSCALTDGGGEPLGRLETFREVTQEVRREEETERAQARHERQMESLEARVELAESFKTELTHNVTHDLRTPLASIKAAVSGLLAGDVTYDPGALRDTLTLIEEETDRLQRRVQNLLSMAKMESGGATLQRDWLDVADVVSSSVESLRSLRGDRAIRLEFAEDLPLVLADYDQLQIAVRNLLENAFLYSPAGSQIEIGVSRGLGQIRIRIRDYGTGLMPDEFERVFDKFYRGRAARRIPGTGLGLPICRGIAEAHGGRLWAEHVPGGGVAFVLSIPTSDAEDEVVSLGGGG